MRFYQQLDDFRCGPYLIANIIVWSGDNTYRDKILTDEVIKDTISKDCKCKAPEGTYITYFLAALRKVRTVKIVKKQKPTIHRINKHLRKTGAVILSIPLYDKVEKKWFWHFALVTGYDSVGNLYAVVNLNEGEIVTWITEGALKYKISHPGVEAWYVVRRRSNEIRRVSKKSIQDGSISSKRKEYSIPNLRASRRSRRSR